MLKKFLKNNDESDLGPTRLRRRINSLMGKFFNDSSSQNDSPTATSPVTVPTPSISPMASNISFVVISNCQGPVLMNRFLKKCSKSFASRFNSKGVFQVQNLTNEDIPAISEALDSSEVIIAQPIVGTEIEKIRISALKEFAVVNDRHLITFPAAHFSCLTPTARPRFWKSDNLPFGANDDLALGTFFLKGLSVEDATMAYHEVEIYTRDELETLIEQNIIEFEKREEAFDTTIPLSGFYRENWRRERLHYVKSHPTSIVYQYLAKQMATYLGVDDLDQELLASQLGNSNISMPIMRKVKQTLKLEFDDDEATGRHKNLVIPFQEIVQKFYDYYNTLDPEEIEPKIKYHGALEFDRISTWLK